MSVSRVHHCISQEMVAQGLTEPPAKKCTCRKFIPYREADKLVKSGTAAWIVVKRERGTQEVTCDLCKGDKEIRNCANCRGRGKVWEAAVWDTYNNDIVLVSEASVDKKEKKYRPALAMKTPRVATIESEHIIRAYVDGGPQAKEAAARIEEYGHMNQIVLQELGAELKDVATGKTFLPGKLEPKDDAKKSEGRKYDWGRAI